MPTGSPPPGRLQLSPLLLPTYQWRSCSSWREPVYRARRQFIDPRHSRRGSVHLQERFVGLTCCLTRLSRKFALQNRDAGVVDAQSSDPVATQGIEAHQVAVSWLVQRIIAQESLSSLDRGIIITLLLQERNQTFCSLEKQLAQAISFRQNPLIVAAGQQVTTIQLYHLLERLPQRGRVLGLLHLLCPGQRLFKIQDIKGPGGIRMFWQPLQVVSIGVEEMVGMRESLPQLMQQLAQVRICLGLVRIGPQEKNQVRASLGSSPMQHEIGKEG